MKKTAGLEPAARPRITVGAERLPEWAAKAVELAESNWTRTAIAERIGVSVPRVSFVLKRCGLPAGTPGRRRSAAVTHRRERVRQFLPRHSIEAIARRERAASRIAAGDSLEEIARDEGVDPSTIWRALQARGVRFRSPGRRPRYLVGDRRRRKTCERPGCDRTFVVYPCDEHRRHHCSDQCEALELWRTGRVSPRLLEGENRGRMRQRWLGRWKGREAGKLGGRERGRLSYWTREALPAIEEKRRAFVEDHDREPTLRELENLTGVPKSTLARLSH